MFMPLCITLLPQLLTHEKVECHRTTRINIDMWIIIITSNNQRLWSGFKIKLFVNRVGEKYLKTKVFARPTEHGKRSKVTSSC